MWVSALTASRRECNAKGPSSPAGRQRKIVDPPEGVRFGELSKRDQFAEPFVTENCRPSEVGPFREVVQKDRVRAGSEIEEALEPFVHAGLSARNKTPEFAAAKLQKIGRPSGAGEISARNKTPQFAAGEAQKNGRPSSGREILAKNKRTEFGLAEVAKNRRPKKRPARAGRPLELEASVGLADVWMMSPPAGPPRSQARAPRRGR